MSNTDVQLLVAQARSEADNPGFKVCQNEDFRGREAWKQCVCGGRVRRGSLRFGGVRFPTVWRGHPIPLRN